MEDTFRDPKPSKGWESGVLILVLMEDTLRDLKTEKKEILEQVLILVLMEDTLRETVLKRIRRKRRVLILVLMEDTLREKVKILR